MTKTGGQIELDVFNLLKDELNEQIKGGVYLQGTRPFDSKNEDVIISFMTGIDADIQTGVLNINTYVPDIDNGNEKLIKDIARCNEIEAFMLSLVEKAKSEYQFFLGQTIRTFAETEINQHFVNVKLKYKRFSK